MKVFTDNHQGTFPKLSAHIGRVIGHLCYEICTALDSLGRVWSTKFIFDEGS
ncbi:hypothetical protein [Eudoraea sp.]|uniref:hypothetical protein n=1 Tax=Eudoraea sp. TaxID=1979955 RepID=UPI003C777D4C